MPKVDKINIKWLGVYTDFEIHFNKKNGFFIKNCPIEVLKFNEHFRNSYDKIKDLTNMFKQALFDAEEAMKSTSKVILIELTIGTAIYTNVTNQYHIDNDHPMGRFVVNGFNGIHDYGFSIHYEILNKVVVGEKVDYYHIPTEGHLHSPRFNRKDNHVEIPYTEESVQTLEKIKSDVTSMVNKIVFFFSMKEEILSRALETGNLKMLNESYGKSIRHEHKDTGDY